jgi:hypothetical protein
LFAYVVPAAMASFQQAFVSLLSVAPSPLFPKARDLYLRKYALETTTSESETALERFRTFVVSEEIQESTEGILRVRAKQFALVHWQAPQTNAEDYLAYLQRRWDVAPDSVSLSGESWFRDGGAYAVFQAPAVYERALSMA